MDLYKLYTKLDDLLNWGDQLTQEFDELMAAGVKAKKANLRVKISAKLDDTQLKLHQTEQEIEKTVEKIQTILGKLIDHYVEVEKEIEYWRNLKRVCDQRIKVLENQNKRRLAFADSFLEEGQKIEHPLGSIIKQKSKVGKLVLGLNLVWPEWAKEEKKVNSNKLLREGLERGEIVPDAYIQYQSISFRNATKEKEESKHGEAA